MIHSPHRREGSDLMMEYGILNATHALKLEGTCNNYIKSLSRPQIGQGTTHVPVHHVYNTCKMA